MRLDQYLKHTRIIKQRSVAKWACDSGRVSISGRKAKAGTEVRVGDEMSITLRDSHLIIRVVEVPTGNVSKERAAALYEVIEER